MDPPADDPAPTLPAELARALGSYDVALLRSLLTEQATHWANITDQMSDREHFLHQVATEADLVESPALVTKRVRLTADGFVLQGHSTGSLADGSSWSVPLCLVVTTDANKIRHIEEYVDSRPVRPLLRAMAARLRSAADP